MRWGAEAVARLPQVGWLVVAVLQAGCERALLIGEDDVRAPRDGTDLDDTDADVDGGTDAGERPGVVLSACAEPYPAGLDASLVAALRTSDGTPAEPLLPYADTVFPRGLMPPMVRWRGAGAGAALLVLEGSGLRYEGCVSTDAADRLSLPEPLWRAAEDAALRGDGRFSLRVSLAADGAVAGSFSVALALARTRVRGSVVYQSYGPSGTAPSASLVRQPLSGSPGAFAPVIGCSGCHGLARDGSRLVVQQNAIGQSYPLASGVLGASSAPLVGLTGPEFAALTPDGAWYVAPAHPTNGFGPRTYGAGYQNASGLFRATDGAPAASAEAPSGALTPSFSPDGRKLVFNDYASAGGHSLAISDFDGALPAFSAPRELYRHDSLYPAWPVMLPDGRVLFTLTGDGSFSGGGAGLDAAMREAPVSQLLVVDPSAAAPTLLHRANGYVDGAAAEAGQSYLSGADEPDRWYYPNVLAQDVDDYVFVCFDGYRRVTSDTRVRAIWCSGLATAAPGADPSAPPFFLPGQDVRGGVVRALASEDAQ
jgi:hypothetical protein